MGPHFLQGPIIDASWAVDGFTFQQEGTEDDRVQCGLSSKCCDDSHRGFNQSSRRPHRGNIRAIQDGKEVRSEPRKHGGGVLQAQGAVLTAKSPKWEYVS